ncbi:hypothetical protein FACS1894181_18450 [Bacteroidia bacterium]|nr:hypothetical protein FACS1894181_18450 [Bacteroidia bacterium]
MKSIFRIIITIMMTGVYHTNLSAQYDNLPGRWDDAKKAVGDVKIKVPSSSQSSGRSAGGNASSTSSKKTETYSPAEFEDTRRKISREFDNASYALDARREAKKEQEETISDDMFISKYRTVSQKNNSAASIGQKTRPNKGMEQEEEKGYIRKFNKVKSQEGNSVASIGQAVSTAGKYAYNYSDQRLVKSMIEKVYAASPRNVPKPIANAIIGKGSEAVTDLVHATTGVTIRKTSIKDDVNGYFKFILGRFGLGETLVDDAAHVYNTNVEMIKFAFTELSRAGKGDIDPEATLERLKERMRQTSRRNTEYILKR